MRVTVLVEALAEENAHGEYRDMALAAFKERKFAMPVQLDDTFETVWSDIEQRYKTNYLSPQQASTFSIKKLQDAYDCDLDMTDTVGAIFEGEPDRKMHLIKVVPHFIFRETSVVPGSMLRPAGAQKRAGDDTEDGTNKRRRIESQQRCDTNDPRDPSPNRPLPSTESRQAMAPIDTDVRSVRSRSGMSLLELSRNETGQAPFNSNTVKQESVEPGRPPALNGTNAASSDALLDAPHIDDALPESDGESAEEEQTTASEHAAPAQLNTQDSAIHKSPISSVEPAPAASTKSRRDVYRVPSSPEFMHKKATLEKPAKTYGRSPRSGADLLNMARRLGRTTKETDTSQPGASASTPNKARAFQRIQSDEIESTPHQQNGSSKKKKNLAAVDGGVELENEDDDLTASFLEKATGITPNKVQTPVRKTSSKIAKPGSLRKPSRASLIATPASAKHAIKPKAVATPASTTTSKSSAMGRNATSSVAGSSKGGKTLGEETMSRMERLEKLLNASQHTPKRQGDVNSPARSDSVKSQDRSHRLSPEVRISVPKKPVTAKADATAINTQSTVQSPPVRMTPIKSPVPFPPSRTQKPKLAQAPTPSAVEVSKSGKPGDFKKPAVKISESPALSTRMNKTSAGTLKGTLKRSEIPLPPNVRNLRRSSSLQASPLSNGNVATGRSSPSVQPKIDANSNPTTPQASRKSSRKAASDDAELATAASPVTDTIVISSAASSSADSSNAEDEERREPRIRDAAGTVNQAKTSAGSKSSVKLDATEEADHDDSAVVDKALNQSEKSIEQSQPTTTLVAPPQVGSQPPSGQGSSRDVPVGNGSWGFGSLSRTNDAEQATATAPTAPTSEDEGFAEQDIYSTAIEDNASRSRSGSANTSLRSSPAISRRPARFLSHSPTPDASDSDVDSDGASPALSRAASPRADDKDGSESESESSSDSSEDDDVETLNPHAKSISDPNANAVPASSPPLSGVPKSITQIPQTTQSPPVENSASINRTPVPLPTQQSSQVPGSSQSVSVQAADRRRYTGFRSLREQLADTKAAQATTQKKTFDPRTMSLGRLMKGKPLAGLGADDDESSDDESSSSSSDDSD